MPKVLVVAFAMLAGPAWAEATFNGEAVSELWLTALMMCYRFETPRREVSPEAANAACGFREEFGADLVANGWCFDRDEREWDATCPDQPKLD